MKGLPHHLRSGLECAQEGTFRKVLSHRRAGIEHIAQLNSTNMTYHSPSLQVGLGILGQHLLLVRRLI